MGKKTKRKFIIRIQKVAATATAASAEAEEEQLVDLVEQIR